jgi:alkylation response protein AidB-like acyl-CoA dehydrogenase
VDAASYSFGGSMSYALTNMAGTRPDSAFGAWLAHAADGLDTGTEPAAAVLPHLVDAGLAAAGVPVSCGGAGGDIVDGVAAVSAVAQGSLAAALVLWGHRTYIEYLLQSPNKALGAELLPSLLSGSLAGATGLSNAMKFLAGLEPLQVTAEQEGETLTLNGRMPWVTNLRPQGFHVAAVVDHSDGGARVVSLAHDDAGLKRSKDLSLLAVRSSNTAAIALANVEIKAKRILHSNAREWLPQVRPAFTGLQCGMSIGLARRALAEAKNATVTARVVLAEPLLETEQQLDHAEKCLFAGLRSRSFEADAAPLFELRLALAEIVSAALSLELQAAGGRAYLVESGRGFARRWREAAFIPVITPSLVQLKTALQQRQRSAA